MISPDEFALRGAMRDAMRQLAAQGLNRGTAGNLGVRCGDRLLVTPSGMRAEAMTPDDMVLLDFDGTPQGTLQPTSEWRLHRDLLAARPDIGAVVHTHSMFATTLACQQRDIPPFHYMVAVAGGNTIRCAPYALFGCQELSDTARVALDGRLACLLAHHGLVALGRDLDHALAVAEMVEELCEQYWRILQIGEPLLLSDTQMREALERFKTYGQWNAPQST